MTQSDIRIEQSVLRLIYMKYQSFFLPIGIICIAILLTFTLLKAQVEDYFADQEKIAEIKSKISVLRNNLDILSAINTQKQQDDVTLAIVALPLDKDFIGILYAVNAASSKAAIGLNDYSFSVGPIATTAAQTATAINSRPSLEIDLDVNGNLPAFETFMTQLASSLPLSSVSKLSYSNSSGGISVLFFYSLLSQQNVSFDSPIQTLNAQNNVVLQKLSSFQAQQQSASLVPTAAPATGSAH